MPKELVDMLDEKDFDRVQLSFVCNQRNHDFWLDGQSFLTQLDSTLEDGFDLHFVNLWLRNPQATAAVTQHRIAFLQLFNAASQFFWRFV